VSSKSASEERNAFREFRRSNFIYLSQRAFRHCKPAFEENLFQIQQKRKKAGRMKKEGKRKPTTLKSSHYNQTRDFMTGPTPRYFYRRSPYERRRSLTNPKEEKKKKGIFLWVFRGECASWGGGKRAKQYLKDRQIRSVHTKRPFLLIEGKKTPAMGGKGGKT